MESKLKKNYKRYLFCLPLCLFIIDYCLINSGKIKVIDHIVYELVSSIESPTVTNVVIFITNMGDFVGIGIVVLLLLLFYRKVGLHVGIVTLLQPIVNIGLKAIFKRPRPSFIHLVDVSNYSFPSGHAMAITGMYGMIIYFLYRSNFKYRKFLIALCSLMIVLVDLSRVYLGVHYFSDVVGGTLLAITIILLYVNLVAVKITN